MWSSSQISQATPIARDISKSLKVIKASFAIQFTGLVISVTAMVLNFMGKSKKPGHGNIVEPAKPDHLAEEMQRMLDYPEDPEEGDVELANRK